jgi:ferredoxin
MPQSWHYFKLIHYFCRKFTINYSLTNKNFTTMAYVIDDTCVACGTCASVCPTGAISEGDKYEIDPDVCISCGSCAEACPNGSIQEG